MLRAFCFAAQPRLVTHVDDAFIAAVTRLYRELIPAGGDVLDLMSSWVSHLPQDVSYNRVVGHGMNAAEVTTQTPLSRIQFSASLPHVT